MSIERHVIYSGTYLNVFDSKVDQRLAHLHLCANFTRASDVPI